MNGTSATEIEYVPRDLFDIHLQNIRDRENSDKELNEERFDKLQTIMEKNFALLNEKLEHVTDTLTVAINDTNTRIDDIHASQNKWFTVFGILFTAAAVITPIAVAIVQHVLK